MELTPEPIPPPQEEVVPAAEPVQVPVEQDDTASSVVSSDPIPNVMPTPTFGPIQLYENIPRNDTQDFRVVCDKMNLRTRREVALAFEHLLQGLAGVPPKVSAEQEGFMEPIDVRRL